MTKIYTSLFFTFMLFSMALSQTEVTIPASRDNTIYQPFFNGPLSNGSGDYFFTGLSDGESGISTKRALLRFDLQDFVPADAQITSVILTLNMNRTTTGATAVALHDLQSDWGEGASDAFGGEGGGAPASDGDATWLHTFYFANLPNSNLWTNEGGDFDANSSATTTVDTIGTYTWGSTEGMVNSVQSWLENPQANFGWILLGDESGERTSKRYISRNNPDGNGPELLVTYIIPPNIPPVAVNDTSETDEEEAVNLFVLSNDSDPDGFINSSSVEILSGPSNGSVELFRGIVTYTPDDDFFGTDIFRYSVEDDEGATSNAAQVNITVHPVNDPPIAVNDEAETDEDMDVGITILANDQDDHGFDISSINITSGPFNGNITATDPNTGVVNYSPINNFFGPDSFSYTVQDDSGSISNTATVLITVNSINDNPIADNDVGEVDEDGLVTIDILANDDDIDGTINAASVNITTDATQGTTQVNALTGQVRYVPDADYFGEDSFIYTVNDNEGATSNAATVTITINSVNDAPVAVDDEAITDEDSDVQIDLVNNDTDQDGSIDASTVSVTLAPANGSNDLNELSGVVTYMPDNNFFGADSFRYTVLDDSGQVSNMATVRIIINDINDDPVANADSAFVDEDNLIEINILTNDTDIDGTIDPSSISTTQPSFGSILINNQTGTITYEPDNNYFGNDNFSYTVQDNDAGLSNSAAVFITVNSVNDAPIAVNDEANTAEDTPVNIDILANDSDIDGILNPSSVNITNPPDNGSITNINSVSGVVTYQPAAGFNGEDSFTYTVNDDSGAVSNQATVSINVGSVNDAPSAVADEAETNEDTDVVINILANDSDSDGELIPATVAIVADPQMGDVVSINSETGAVTYRPDDNYFGEDAFSYTVEDDSGAVSEQTLVSITVHAVNDDPIAVNDEAETNEETLIIINVLANDNDVESNIDPSTVSVISGPSNGTINSINSESGAISYTPIDNFNGEDSFSYTVEDDSGAVSNDATVAITISPQNDRPIISEIPVQTFNEDDSLIISIQALSVFVNDPDNEDSTLIFTFTEANNISAMLESESVKFSSPAHWFGEDSIKVIVSDGELSDSAMVYFNVQSVNDLPLFTNLPQEIEFENTGSFPLELDNIAEDNDLPNDSLRWDFSVDADSVLLDYNSNAGLLTLTAPNFAGFAVLRITVTDDSSASISDSILVHVTGTVTSINDQSKGQPDKFSLFQNYPNPFNPSTKIAFDLARQETVKLSVYNIRGQKVAVLINETLARGKHFVEFQAQDFSSGIYFYMIEAGNFKEIKRMLLIK